MQPPPACVKQREATDPAPDSAPWDGAGWTVGWFEQGPGRRTAAAAPRPRSGDRGSRRSVGHRSRGYRRRAASSASVTMAWLNPRASSARTSNPFSSWRTLSASPPASAAITGSPLAIASRATRPHVSVRDGSTHRSADAYRSARVSRSRNPALPCERRPGRDVVGFRSFAGDDERRTWAQATVGAVPGVHQHPQVLLRGEAPDVQHDDGIVRPGHPASPPGVPPVGPEMPGIDATAPDHRVPQPAAHQLVAHCDAGRLDHAGRPVEVQQPPPPRAAPGHRARSRERTAGNRCGTT